MLGAGSNLGGRRSILRAARVLLRDAFGPSLRSAPVWETEPLGPAQPRYLNGGFAVHWDDDLQLALDRCRVIEASLGRERRERWGPRTLDLDLLWHGSRSVRSPTITVPHAELHARTFALDPLLALVDDDALRAVRAGLPPSPASVSLDDDVPGDAADDLALALDRALDAQPAGEGPTRVLPVAVEAGGSLDATAAAARAAMRRAGEVVRRVAVLHHGDDGTRLAVLLAPPR